MSPRPHKTTTIVFEESFILTFLIPSIVIYLPKLPNNDLKVLEFIVKIYINLAI